MLMRWISHSRREVSSIRNCKLHYIVNEMDATNIKNLIWNKVSLLLKIFNKVLSLHSVCLINTSFEK